MSDFVFRFQQKQQNPNTQKNREQFLDAGSCFELILFFYLIMGAYQIDRYLRNHMASNTQHRLYF